MAQTKAPLSERDANIASKKPTKGKKAPAALQKSNAPTPHQSLEEVANTITKTHGKKRAHEDDRVDHSLDSSNPNEVGPSNEAIKRKADAELDKTDTYKFDCNQVRNKINALVHSGEMKVGEFQKQLGVSASAWSNFMKQSGKTAGQFSDTYSQAHDYFVKREKQGLKIPSAKKAKTSSSTSTNTATNDASTSSKSKSKSKNTDDKYDISNVTLDNESPSTRVPIFDTCDDLRTKINAYLREAPGHSQAGLARALTSIVQSTRDFNHNQSVTGTQIKSFLDKKGPRAGATSATYYAGYVFFEKVRVGQGKPKSKKRTEMEEAHGPQGCPTDSDSSSRFWLGPGEHASEDKYGIVHFVQLPPGASATRPRRR